MNTLGIVADEGLQVIECAVRFEEFRQYGQADRGGEETSRAAAALFFGNRMRRRVATEHEFWVRFECRCEQGLAIFRTLCNRLAE